MGWPDTSAHYEWRLFCLIPMPILKSLGIYSQEIGFSQFKYFLKETDCCILSAGYIAIG